MLARLAAWHPFRTPEAQRLAVLFAIVYFAQGMWYLPNQTITIVLKDRGFGAGQVATFFAVTGIPWLVKPLYGLVSDFLPLWGRRRKTYLLVTSAVATVAGLALGTLALHGYGWLVALFTVMGLGLAFTDVMVDAVMVENGKALGLTGPFQAVQWAAIYAASVGVGLVGGYLAARRNLSGAFLLAASFPLVSFVMALFVIREPRAPANRAVAAATVAAIREALGRRELWIVAGFIFFWIFSPSFGPALLFYQTDALGFSQELIGGLSAVTALGSIAGAVCYAPLSRRVPLRRLIVGAIGLTVVGTLAYLGYRGVWSAVAIEVVYGVTAMVAQLAFLDLAAKACPARVEATFFALLMSVYNGGQELSQVTGGYLYDALGFTPLVLISAALTAFGWALVPLIGIERIEAQAQRPASGA
jgi:MFS family permease